jgi:hypothetical protein
MNITRIINLFRAYLIENKKKLLIICFITFGIVAFGLTVSREFETFLSFPYYALFFLACFTIFGFKSNRMHFFILPSTTAEKFLYAIVTIVIMGAVLYLLSLAGAYIGYYLIHPLIYFETSNYLGGIDILNDSIWAWESYLSFASTLSVFLFGSIYFKTNAFFKTLGIVVGFLFGIGIYFLILFYIIFGNTISSDDSLSFNIASDYVFLQNYWYVVPIAIIVFFLSLTYLRLRETEV